MATGVGITRLDGETWRQAAERIASRWGLQDEVLEEFDMAVAAGEPEDQAAWGACMEWDVADMVSGD